MPSQRSVLKRHTFIFFKEVQTTKSGDKSVTAPFGGRGRDEDPLQSSFIYGTYESLEAGVNSLPSYCYWLHVLTGSSEEVFK